MCIKASECIPATCHKLNSDSDSADGRRKVPGWSKEVEHLKQEALSYYRNEAYHKSSVSQGCWTHYERR